MEEYLNTFKVLGSEGSMNCEYLSELLYRCILNKYNIRMDEDEYCFFEKYSNRIFDLIEDMREKDNSYISELFTFAIKKNIYLSDIVIMLWCLPRPGTFRSKMIYDNYYRDYIKTYNNKMISNITHDVMKNFCIETLTKTNYVPIHCIDYLWYYMSNMRVEMNFIGYDRYLFVEYSGKSDTFLCFQYNIQYLLDMGLGNVIYPNDPLNRTSFRNFLKKFLFDEKVIEVFRSKKQLSKIYENPTKYFE